MKYVFILDLVLVTAVYWFETFESHAATCFWSQVFAYDYCFWSMDETDKERFAGQFLKWSSSHCIKSSNIFLIRNKKTTDDGFRKIQYLLWNSVYNVVCVCVCVQVKRWSSSALGKVFSTTPSRATMPVSLPMDKLVMNHKDSLFCLPVWRDSISCWRPLNNPNGTLDQHRYLASLA